MLCNLEHVSVTTRETPERQGQAQQAPVGTDIVAATHPLPDEVVELPWLVWSHEHSAFWKPSRCGYTKYIEKAGRYSKVEADEICGARSIRAASTFDKRWPGLPPEICFPAPEYAPTSTPTEQSVLRSALERRDRKAGECPDSKLDPDKECPRCGAMSNEGCRITVLADAVFVHDARKALEATHIPSEGTSRPAVPDDVRRMVTSVLALKTPDYEIETVTVSGLKAMARFIASLEVPDTHVLVPRVPTEAMLNRAEEACYAREEAGMFWSAMIAATEGNAK